MLEAPKWRRYRLRVAAAHGGSICKAARRRDRSHFGVPAGFDRFCPWPRQRALEYTHMPAPRFLALNKIASNLGHALTRRRSEEHTSELQSLMRLSYAVFCLNKTTH